MLEPGIERAGSSMVLREQKHHQSQMVSPMQGHNGDANTGLTKGGLIQRSRLVNHQSRRHRRAVLGAMSQCTFDPGFQHCIMSSCCINSYGVSQSFMCILGQLGTIEQTQTSNKGGEAEWTTVCVRGMLYVTEAITVTQREHRHK